MKRLFSILIVFVSGMFLATVVEADDAADVRAAVMGLNAARNEGNVDALAKYIHPERSIFYYGGALLSEGFDKNGFKAEVDAGLKFDWVISHLGVKVYGDAAIVTGYNVGTITSPDGTAQQGSR